MHLKKKTYSTFCLTHLPENTMPIVCAAGKKNTKNKTARQGTAVKYVYLTHLHNNKKIKNTKIVQNLKKKKKENPKM